MDSVDKLNRLLNQIDSSSGSKRKADEMVPLPPAPVWLMYLDMTSGKYYYYNTVTKQTQWEPPDSRLTPAQTKPTGSAAGGSSTQADTTNDATEHSGAISEANDAKEIESATSTALGGTSLSVDDGLQDKAPTPAVGAVSSASHAAVATLPLDYLRTAAPFSAPVLAASSASSDPFYSSQQDYVARASFNSKDGRFTAADGTYWDKVGRPNDREGRQLSNFMDLASLEKNREEAKIKKAKIAQMSGSIDWKSIKKEKKAKAQAKANAWLLSNDD